MVKIVIRKEREVIQAYLKGMGFSEEYDVEAFLKEHLELDGRSEEDISALLDGLIYAAAAKVLPPELSRQKATALYKALYVELNGAQKWGSAPLSSRYEDPQYVKLMREHVFKSVPECCYSEMPRQELESFKPSLVHKLKLFFKLGGDASND